MDSRAIKKAESRLRIAKKAVADLESSKTYGDFSDHWYIFLTSAKNVYTVLEQGSKVSPQSRQWFGAKANIRKNDPLLQYLYEARNDDEHGLGSSIEVQSSNTYEIGASAPGFSNAMRLDGQIGGIHFRDVTVSNFGTAIVSNSPPPPSLRITALDNKPVLVRRTPDTTILAEVTARGNRKYPPPDSHMGKPLKDMSPVSVAKLAISQSRSRKL